MGSFKIVDEENNIWIGSLVDFNANIANNFYSYGMPDGYTALFSEIYADTEHFHFDLP